MIHVPALGHGIGLRTEHYRDVLETPPPVDWFEVISDNFMVPGGNPRRVLRAVRERWPVVLHGVSLSLGAVDPLNERYLDALAALAREVEPAMISDHLCWGSHGGAYAHDLLPLPFTEEALANAAARVLRVQDRLKRQILVENVSSYVAFTQSTMPEWEYLAALTREIEPAIVSDHLCWGSHGGKYAHDLLPLPFTEEALAHVAERVLRVQERLGRQILVENVSSYVAFSQSTMREEQFLVALAERTDCGLLLDVNNVFVSGHNHGFDARAFIDSIPVGRVGQFHLAGHSQAGELLLDTHDHPVRDEVWELYRHAVARFGAVPTLIEWDDKLPSLARVVEESARAKSVAGEALAARGAPLVAAGEAARAAR